MYKLELNALSYGMITNIKHFSHLSIFRGKEAANVLTEKKSILKTKLCMSFKGLVNLMMFHSAATHPFCLSTLHLSVYGCRLRFKPSNSITHKQISILVHKGRPEKIVASGE